MLLFLLVLDLLGCQTSTRVGDVRDMVFQDLYVACTLSLVYDKMFLDDDYLALRGLVTWMAGKELLLES